MIWALKENEIIKATPKNKALCPSCNSELISKCGIIKIWHWAHKSEKDCDDFSEPESEWHLNWKNKFPKEWQEVSIENHRADIQTKSRLVIELQNSPLSSEDIIKREKFYREMVWILNGNSLCRGLELRTKKYSFCCKSNVEKEFSIDGLYLGFKCKSCNNFTNIITDESSNIKTFRWKNPPKSWWLAEKKIYVDINEDNLFLIKKIFNNIPCGGYGILMSKKEFLKEVGVDEI